MSDGSRFGDMTKTLAAFKVFVNIAIDESP